MQVDNDKINHELDKERIWIGGPPRGEILQKMS